MGLDGLTIQELERNLSENRELLQRVQAQSQALEEALHRRRHTHATLDGIEEAIGLLVSILRDEELASLLRAEKIRRLREVLDKVRQSPTAYRDDGKKTLPDLRTWIDGYDDFRQQMLR